jgi:hypothetical protein
VVWKDHLPAPGLYSMCVTACACGDAKEELVANVQVHVVPSRSQVRVNCYPSLIELTTIEIVHCDLNIKCIILHAPLVTQFKSLELIGVEIPFGSKNYIVCYGYISFVISVQFHPARGCYGHSR